MKEFNREKLNVKRLEERESKLGLDIMIDPESKPEPISQEDLEKIERVSNSILESKEKGAPVILAFGAHLIKNGLSKIMIEMMNHGFVNHLLSNGAVSIHDWEFAYFGRSTENVKEYVKQGQFGIWDQTGKYINSAINFGASQDLGQGEAIGKLILENGLGREVIKHPNKEYSVLAQAYKLNIPFSISSSIGHDITHSHPNCRGEALGKTSYRDFLYFTETLKSFQHGTLISMGSAITSPMVFEKALSMAKNISIQENKALDEYNIFVNDIQPSNWDWSKEEPPMDSPDYYLRFFKTFSRMGGKSEYVQLDNVKFLHNLYHTLKV